LKSDSQQDQSIFRTSKKEDMSSTLLSRENMELKLFNRSENNRHPQIMANEQAS
jgi:hypothetical protein